MTIHAQTLDFHNTRVIVILNHLAYCLKLCILFLIWTWSFARLDFVFGHGRRDTLELFPYQVQNPGSKQEKLDIRNGLRPLPIDSKVSKNALVLSQAKKKNTSRSPNIRCDSPRGSDLPKNPNPALIQNRINHFGAGKSYFRRWSYCCKKSRRSREDDACDRCLEARSACSPLCFRNFALLLLLALSDVDLGTEGLGPTSEAPVVEVPVECFCTGREGEAATEAACTEVFDIFACLLFGCWMGLTALLWHLRHS